MSSNEPPKPQEVKIGNYALEKTIGTGKFGCVKSRISDLRGSSRAHRTLSSGKNHEPTLIHGLWDCGKGSARNRSSFQPATSTHYQTVGVLLIVINQLLLPPICVWFLSSLMEEIFRTIWITILLYIIILFSLLNISQEIFSNK